MKDEWVQHLVAHLPVLICALDEDGCFIDANAAFGDQLERAPETLVGKHFSELVHPKDLERVTSLHEEVMARGVAIASFESRLVHRDGSPRWFSWSCPPPRNGVLVAVGVDISQRHAELAETDALRNQLRSVLETVPEYITMVRPDGEIEYINRTYPGVTPEQVVGTSLLNWLPPDHREPMGAAIESVLAGETNVELTVQGSGADGGPTWYRSRLGALKRDGEIVSVIIAGEDITASMLAEQRRTQSARLETAGRIAAAVAHDFNNDLMAMLLSVEILQQQDLDDPTVNEELSELHSTILRARNTTRQLSQALRQPTETRGKLELGKEVRTLEPVLRRAAGVNDVEFAIAPGQYPVPLSPDELTRVLTHLVDNSRHALQKPGRIEIQVAERVMEPDSTQWLEPRSYVELAVTDDGPGIPEHVRELVFDPFFSTKPKAKGFGLATCCAIARARGGDITILCPPEGGTRVAIWLPTITEAPLPIAPEAPDPPTATAKDGWTIVLAEDHDYTRTRMARYLSSCGHRVMSARDGVDALEMLERHPGSVDALVSDLAMPRLDGVSLLETVHRQRPEIALVAMSGNVETSYSERLSPLGIRLLEKPVLPKDLLESVGRAIARSRD